MLRPIPDCPGPKLEPFEGVDEDGHISDIKFLKKIGEGLHSYTFKVDIGGAIYCLKVFKCYTSQLRWEYRNVKWGDGDSGPALAKEMEVMPPRILYRQIDPFARECRAYGRLKETRSEGRAGRCHGYLFVTAAQEKEMLDRFRFRETRMHKNSTWGEWPFQRNESDEGRELRALVKEFLVDKQVEQAYNIKHFPKLSHKYRSGQSFTPDDIPRMMRDLRALHRLGIAVGDVRKDNYIQGRLIDFSVSRTVPHMLMDPDIHRRLVDEGAIGPGPARTAAHMAEQDMKDFDSMIHEFEWQHVGVKEREDFHIRVYPFFFGTRIRGTNRYPRNPRVDDPLSYDWKQARKVRQQRAWRAARRAQSVGVDAFVRESGIFDEA